MKIISLTAENLKRLTAVHIEPDGNMVQITGKNGQGKTSVLDAIWWALAGTSNVQTTPIRKGEESATIQLDLGEIVVRRKFIAQEGGGYTTSLIVENGEGARFQSPQTMLDQILGELTFDPLAFARAKAPEKVAALRSLAPEFDFAAAEARIKGAFDERTIANREAKAAQAAAEALSAQIPANLPEAISVADVARQMAEANAHNEAQSRLSARRHALEREADTLENQIRELQRKKAERVEELSALAPVEDNIDTAPMQERLEAADRVNALHTKAEDRDAEIAKAKAAQERSEALTATIDGIKADARRAIAEAKIPVEGLTISDGEVLLRGVPFDQASDAEQLSASVAIAMALNPKLRVIRVRDGSLLDEDALAQMSAIADAEDFQIWIERVDSSGSIGFVLEDGHLKEPEDAGGLFAGDRL